MVAGATDYSVLHLSKYHEARLGSNPSDTMYIFGGNLRLAKITDGVKTFFHKDHLGSSVVITDENGNEISGQRSVYKPFGDDRENPGITESAYKFTDQELDFETGLYNYDARLYDPVIGRFITADSIIPDLYDPQSLNRYSYVRNNPLIYVDPSGHLFIVDDIVGWAIETFTGNSNQGFFQGVAENFTESWSVVGNTFNTFENNSNIGDFFSDLGELGLRLTWDLPNEFAGMLTGYFAVEYLGGTTRSFENVQQIETHNIGRNAFTVGSKVIGHPGALSSGKLFKDGKTLAHHEQGHYYQGLAYGPLWFLRGFQSLWHYNNFSGSAKDYYSYASEREANEFAGVKLK